MSKDTIYRQDAVDAINELHDKPNAWLDLAVEALEKLPSAEPEINKQELIRIMNTGIIATNTEDVYSCGMRNGIRWCRALLEDDPPKFEDANHYAEPERKKGKWIKVMEGNAYRDKCNQCGRLYPNAYGYNFCPNCGADMRGEQR